MSHSGVAGLQPVGPGIPALSSPEMGIACPQIVWAVGASLQDEPFEHVQGQFPSAQGCVSSPKSCGHSSGRKSLALELDRFWSKPLLHP